MAILGIDPGTRKCGYAVIEAIGAPPLALGIEPTEALAARVAELVARFAPSAIALGAGTHAAIVAPLLAATGVPVRLVNERETTLLARRRTSRRTPRGAGGGSSRPECSCRPARSTISPPSSSPSVFWLLRPPRSGEETLVYDRNGTPACAQPMGVLSVSPG